MSAQPTYVKVGARSSDGVFVVFFSLVVPCDFVIHYSESGFDSLPLYRLQPFCCVVIIFEFSSFLVGLSVCNFSKSFCLATAIKIID